MSIVKCHSNKSEKEPNTPCPRSAKEGTVYCGYHQKKQFMEDQECQTLDFVTGEEPLDGDKTVNYTNSITPNDIIERELSYEYSTNGLNMCKFFDMVIKDPPIVVNNGKCKLIPKCVGKYLSALDAVNHQLSVDVKKLLDMTRYISHSELEIKLHQSFDQFVKMIGTEPFTLIYTDEYINSEHLCIWLLWPKIKKLYPQIEIKYYQDKSITTQNVLSIDDVSYSGGNLDETISRFSKNTKVYAILGVCSQYVFNEFKKFENLILITGEVVPSFSENYSGLVDDYFGTSCNMSPIYLDNKIASPTSTFNYVFYGLVPYRLLSQEDRKFNCCPVHTRQRIPLCKQYPNREIINRLTHILIDNWESLLIAK